MELDYATFDAVSAPVVVVDLAARILHWNHACQALTGVTPAEALGESLFALLHPSGEPEPRPTPLAGLARGETTAHYESDLTTSLGVCHVSWYGRALRDADGAVRAVVLTATNVATVARERRDDGVQLSALLELASDGVFLADMDARYIDVNAAGCRLLGYRRDEIVGKRISELLPPEDEGRMQAEREKLARGGSVVGEWRMRRKDGSYVPVEVSASLLPDRRWLAFVRDATSRRALEDERERLLVESDADRRWLRAVIETVPIGLILFGPTGTVSFNRHAEDLLGLKLSATGGSAQYANRVLYPDGTRVPQDELPSSRVIRTGEPVKSAEYLIEHADGSRVPVLGSAAPILDAGGAVVGGVGAFQDMSERMQAEREIRARERLLNGIFEILPVGVWIADENGRIVRTNLAGERIWAGARYVGISQFGEYKAWWADSGERISADQWALARALTRGETSIGELLRIQCFDGTFKTIINSALPLHDEEGRLAGAIVVNEDVTHLREIEDALRRSVAARDELLGIVAHDLRTPLSAILMQVDVCRNACTTEAAQRALDAMGRQAGRINRLIADLLDVARIDAGKLSIHSAPVPARALLDEAWQAQRSAAAACSLELSVDSSGELPEVSADHERVLQVFDNLIGNAVKFTPPGGSVRIGATPRGDEVLFSVADTGEGIAAENLPHLFDRFWQVMRSDRRGAGLGLAIARGIIEAHGGRLWAESRPAEGSTFFFTLKTAGPGA